jgi:hypothetical protein
MEAKGCATFSCACRTPRHDKAVFGSTCNLDPQVKVFNLKQNIFVITLITEIKQRRPLTVLR